jgi:hypothetical protein
MQEADSLNLMGVSYTSVRLLEFHLSLLTDLFNNDLYAVRHNWFSDKDQTERITVGCVFQRPIDPLNTSDDYIYHVLY